MTLAHRRLALALMSAFLLVPAVSLAQGYPTKPVRLIVPFGTGGTTDIVARVMSEPLGKALQLITDGLQSCLNAQQGGEVASNLNLLYNWACAEILRARLRSEPQRLLAVRQVLSPVAQAWRIQAEAQATS